MGKMLEEFLIRREKGDLQPRAIAELERLLHSVRSGELRVDEVFLRTLEDWGRAPADRSREAMSGWNLDPENFIEVEEGATWHGLLDALEAKFVAVGIAPPMSIASALRSLSPEVRPGIYHWISWADIDRDNDKRIVGLKQEFRSRRHQAMLVPFVVWCIERTDIEVAHVAPYGRPNEIRNKPTTLLAFRGRLIRRFDWEVMFRKHGPRGAFHVEWGPYVGFQFVE